MQYVAAMDLFDTGHSGYTPGYGTQTKLVDLANELLLGMDNH